jgi:DNA-binding FadR family transcriptional regulator
VTAAVTWQPLASSVDEAVFRPVRAGNAFEETVERLLQAVKLGVVQPGERLPPERDLADRLNVSRVTLREAIKALQDAGYIESRRGRYGGTFVRADLPRRGRPTAREVAEELATGLDDALTYRRVVEVGAAEVVAARSLDEYEQRHLTQCLEQCRNASLADYRRMDSRLHLAVAELTLSPSLTSAVAEARMRLNTLLDTIPLLDRNIAHSNRQHDRIVDAILRQDVRDAREAMTEHLAGSAALLRGFLT